MNLPEVIAKIRADRLRAQQQAAEYARERARLDRQREMRANLMVAWGIPRPTFELKFHATRQWRFDFAWLKEKIALEVHGATWAGGHHSRGKGQQDDWEKLNEAQLLGWRVFQCSPKQVDSGAIFETLKKAVDQCQARKKD